VALSVVGTEKLAESGYFRAKIAQEALIRDALVPYTIVQATQFFEFLGGIAQSGTQGDAVHLSTASIQPIASDDVAEAVADAALGAPRHGVTQIAGPDRLSMAALMTRYFALTGDTRKIVSDPEARYFGARLADDTLVPAGEARLGKIGLEQWVAAQAKR